MGDTRWERRRYLSERPLLASRKISTGRMKSLLHLSLAFSLGWTLKYIDWNLHLYWLLSAFSLGWTQKQVGCREMRRCPCALFQMANEDSTAFTETEQDGKNIQCQSSGNGISMNGFFLLPHQAVRKRHFEAYHSWQSRYCDSTWAHLRAYKFSS